MTTVNRAADLSVAHGVYHGRRLVAVVSGGRAYADDVIKVRADRQGIPAQEYKVKPVRVATLTVEEHEERTFTVTVQAATPQEAREQIRRDISTLTLTEGQAK